MGETCSRTHRHTLTFQEFSWGQPLLDSGCFAFKNTFTNRSGLIWLHIFRSFSSGVYSFTPAWSSVGLLTPLL